MTNQLLDTVYQAKESHITPKYKEGARYWIVDKERPEAGSALVESGSPKGIKLLRREMAATGLRAAVTTVFATHGHYDHISGARLLPEAEVMMHEADHYAVKSGDEDLTAAFLYGKSFLPLPNPLRHVEDGEVFMIGRTKVEVIHTPGHDPGSVSFAVTTTEGTLLIAGDTLWGAYSDRFNSNMDDWSNSLDKLSRRHFDILTFGHEVNRPVTDVIGHLAMARRRFGKYPQPSHDGLLVNVWELDPSLSTPDTAA